MNSQSAYPGDSDLCQAGRLVRFLTATALLCAMAAGALADDGRPPSWSHEIREYTQKSLDDEKALGLAAVPLNGPGIEQYVNADRPMTPGSIMKLVTTYAALEILGPNYRWQTDFLTDGEILGDTLKGNLYVRFRGDPKLTHERLWSTLRQLHDMGIRRIDGHLVLDGTYFRLQGFPVFDDNGDNPYAPFLVEPSAYLTNLNLLHFQVRADEQGTRAWVTPALPGISIDNRVIIETEGSCHQRHRLEWTPLSGDDGTITVRVTGALPPGCRSGTYLSLLPHEHYTAALIRTLLAETGVTLTGASMTGPTPDEARLLLRSTSPDLVTMVRDINKWSSNVMARQLLLTLGAEQRNEGEDDDRVTGIRVIYEWLERKGIDTTGMVIDNGSGLTRHGRLTARQGVRILQHAWNSPWAADLMASMPIIAMDGTMARRLNNTGLRGLGRIKTGYLENVRSIAGFTRDENGTTWAVVAMVNHDPAWNGQALLDRVLYSLYHRPPTGTTLSRALPDREQAIR